MGEPEPLSVSRSNSLALVVKPHGHAPWLSANLGTPSDHTPLSAMAYVVTAQKPTKVTHSAVGHFTGPDDLNLIVARGTRFELHIATEDGLNPVFDVPVHGRIATMELFRPAVGLLGAQYYAFSSDSCLACAFADGAKGPSVHFYRTLRRLRAGVRCNQPTVGYACLRRRCCK